MSDLLDGVGTATEGGLFARAIEPGSGARPAHPDQPENCLNCGTELVGAYCHACGQSGHVHRTIGAFLHDLLHGALHFEGKLWHTLPMLVFRPGALTRRYIAGERARFVSPMALFLFSVFLMFAVFQMVGLTTPTDVGNSEVVAAGVEEARAMASDEIDALREQLLSPELDDRQRATIEARIALLERYLADGDGAGADPEAEELASGMREGAAEAEAGAQEDDMVVVTDPDALAQLSAQKTGIDWLDHAVDKWRANPDLMLYKLQANAYKFSWMLIPLSIPFVWLLFAWRRRFRGYDHAIFVTYSLSFMTLMLIVMSLLGKAGAPGGVLFIIIATAGPLHLYKQLRGAYSLSRFSTIWRFLALSLFIWIIVGLFLQLLFLLGAT